MLTAVNEREITLTLPNGSTRVFALKPEDVDRVGLSHLASHAGAPDVGFRIYYVTVNGKDYLAGAEEIAPPG
jgi:O-acetyl-ADP-ribose deacetylase (regulator of RNase III)